jgi:hypothetical protein
MLIKKIIALGLILPLVAFAKPKSTDELHINPLDLSKEQQVVYFSDLYGGDSQIALSVMECESSGSHSAKGDGGRSNGIFQFQKSSFERMEKDFGEDLNYTSEYDQIKLASWALANPKYQREWTSYRAISNGGKYSFYSSQMKRHYTIYCSLI